MTEKNQDLDGFIPIDTALFEPKKGLLIISDIHLGYEAALSKQGVFIPRSQFKKTVDKLTSILYTIKTLGYMIKKVIVNGDIKHEFGSISDQEWRETLKLIDLLRRSSEELILIKGNHDSILGPIAEKRDIEIKEWHQEDDILFIHGHKLPEDIKEFRMPKDIKTIIIGHMHPAVQLRERSKSEKFKCFLKGNWKDFKIIVLPSFLITIEGSDPVTEDLVGPFDELVKDFEVHVPMTTEEDDKLKTELLYFGTLKELKKLSDQDII